MTSRSLRTLLGVLALGGVLVAVARAEPRQVMSLDGPWNFATDPDNRGEAEKWYEPAAKLPPMPLPGYAAAANGKIRVPGIWDNQGYGTETDKLRHSFIGKGWYKRQVTIPPGWAGRRVFLAITGVCRYAKVWIDDNYLGEHLGAVSAFEYDVTDDAKPGQTVAITIQIDSQQRWDVDALYGCSFLADYMEVAWGGIWGHVLLEARAPAWLSDLYVQPDVPHSTCAASAMLNGKAEAADGAKLEVFDQGGRQVGQATLKPEATLEAGRAVHLKVSLPDAKLWSPDSPTLYTARLSLLKRRQSRRRGREPLRHAAVHHRRTASVAQRQAADALRLRRRPHLSRADGHAGRQAIAPETFADDQILRFQSRPAPQHAHAAGILRRLRRGGYHRHGRVPHLLRRVHARAGQSGKSTCRRARIRPRPRKPTGASGRRPSPDIRNHPSILAWIMGNEMWRGRGKEMQQGAALRSDFQRIAQQYDPGRFFLDADGQDPWILDPQNDREHVVLLRCRVRPPA